MKTFHVLTILAVSALIGEGLAFKHLGKGKGHGKDKEYSEHGCDIVNDNVWEEVNFKNLKCLDHF